MSRQALSLLRETCSPFNERTVYHVTLRAKIIEKQQNCLIEQSKLYGRQANEWLDLLTKCEKGSEEYYVVYSLAKVSLDKMKECNDYCKRLVEPFQDGDQG